MGVVRDLLGISWECNADICEYYTMDCSLVIHWDGAGIFSYMVLVEGSLDVKLSTKWTDEKQRRAESDANHGAVILSYKNGAINMW